MSGYYAWLAGIVRNGNRAPSFGIASIEIQGSSQPVRETVVDDVPFCTLRRFACERRTADTDAAVLICAPLAGHHAVMLRETVETLLPDIDVYITDWSDAREIPLEAGPLGLNDYVHALERFVARAQQQTRTLHVLAICQAAPPAIAACSLLASAGTLNIASLALMGGPVDARRNPTLFGEFARAHSVEWFQTCVIDTVPPPYAGATRRVYPGYVQQAAILTGSPGRMYALWLGSLLGNADHSAEARRELAEYSAVLDMPEAYFLDTIRIIFQEARLARGRWTIDGRRVQPRLLSATPLCTIEATRDDITGAGQTHAAHALCGIDSQAARIRLTMDDCGHYDLFCGQRWRDAIRPLLLHFWREQSGSVEPLQPAAPRPPAQGCKT